MDANAPPRLAPAGGGAHLPGPLFLALRGTGLEGLFRCYTELREAEQDLHAAWAEALDAGTWKPD